MNGRGWDAGAVLLGFVLLVPVLMSAAFADEVRWIGYGLVVWAAWAVSLPWQALGRGLFRLRWLFLALWWVHGWMTPGEFIWSGWPVLTREGVLAGFSQTLRLMALAILAWSLARATTPLALVGVLETTFGWLERFGVPIRRWIALIGFCLAGLSRVREQTLRVQEGLRLRLGVVRGGISGRLERLALAGSALLMGLLWDLRQREEGLRMRGLTGLPPVRYTSADRSPRPGGWWLPLLPGVLWIGQAWLWSLD